MNLYIRTIISPIYLSFLISCALMLSSELAHATVALPKESDWTDHGIVTEAGPTGSWDVRLSAISPCTVVKKNEIYFLYYIGADGDRATDGGPRHWALGEITSTDGIHFTNYSTNPIITQGSHNNEEE